MATEERPLAGKVQERLDLLGLELQRMVEVIVEDLDPELIILFGSLAQDPPERVNEWTDLDLVIVADTDLPFYRRISRLLERARPGVGADLFVYTPREWNKIREERPFLKREVLEKGRVIYERSC